jgi:predicted nucleic acid-binding Zn ribbon protein
VFEDYEILRGRIVARGSILRRYDALGAALVPDLLKTEGQPEGILDFVRTYGLSCGHPDSDARAVGETSEAAHRAGDLLDEWTGAFVSARNLSRYVGLIKKGHHWETGDPMTPSDARTMDNAWQFGMEEFETRGLQRHLRLALRCDDRWTLELVPYGLLGLLWIGLVDMLLEGRRFETCKRCGTLFEMTPRRENGASQRRIYCSNQCRAMVGNDKKRRATKMLMNGISAKKVAVETGVGLRTVKKWAQKSERG